MVDADPVPPPAPEPAPQVTTAVEALDLAAKESAAKDLAPAAEDLFEQMDRLDEDQVVSEMTGRRSAVAEALVYTFQQDGKRISGLSKRGVDEAVRFMARNGQMIRELKLIAKQAANGSGIEARCLAARFLVTPNGREQLMETRWGVKFQPFVTKVFRGGRMQEREDNFVYEKACMKAARNASRRLLPEDIVQGAIERVLALQPEAVKPVGRGAAKASIEAEEKVAAAAPQLEPILVQRVQIGFKECEIPEAERRSLLESRYGVDSVLKMTSAQALQCLNELRVLYKAKQSQGGLK